MFNPNKIKKDFPIFKRLINGKRIVYLDSTATTLKPQSVINKENEYYTRYTANIFRGIYTLSEEATAQYEAVREKTAKFIGAIDPAEIIFTRNTTESINLLMYALSRMSLNGKELATSIMEHHSNFVPWQQLAQGFKILFKIWNGEDSLDTIITRNTKVFAITALSNVLGTIMDIGKIVQQVKSINPDCWVIVDAAQAVPHMKIDVRDWGADFVAFSSHKMLGPTGVGVLWGRRELLEEISPFNYGGEMISEVRVDKTIFKDLPHKFEAGTPNIAGVIGFGAAIDYLERLGMDNVRAHEKEITSYALSSLASIKSITIHGPTDPDTRGGVIAFTMKGAHPHDIAQILNEDNVCIRSGNHCAMPLHTHLHLTATARASFYMYTTKKDVDTLVEVLIKVQKLFS